MIGFNLLIKVHVIFNIFTYQIKMFIFKHRLINIIIVVIAICGMPVILCDGVDELRSMI